MGCKNVVNVRVRVNRSDRISMRVRMMGDNVVATIATCFLMMSTISAAVRLVTMLSTRSAKVLDVSQYAYCLAAGSSRRHRYCFSTSECGGIGLGPGGGPGLHGCFCVQHAGGRPEGMQVQLVLTRAEMRFDRLIECSCCTVKHERVLKLGIFW